MSAIKPIICPACNGTDFEHDAEGNLICAFCGTQYASPRDFIPCPTCNMLNPPIARICMHCGRALGLSCPACDYENPPGVDHCQNCGSPLDRLSSIMARQRNVALPNERVDRLVASKHEDIVYMQEQRERLAQEERERQARLAAQREQTRRQQQRFIVSGILMLILFLIAMAVIVGLVFGLAQ